MKKQGELPGQEKPKVKEIDAAAEAYHDKVRERLDIQREEADLYAQLAAAMKKHKLDVYPIPGTELVVTKDVKEKYHVNKAKKPKEE